MKNSLLYSIFRNEFKVWLPFAIAMFLFGSCLMSGFPQGLVPNLSVPYVYDGDGTLTLYVIQAMTEGSIYFSDRLGYPFGLEYYDFPVMEIGSILILKFFSIFTSSSVALLNIYILTSFVFVFLSAYFVLRLMGVSTIFAVLGAFVYDIIPFHYLRINHTFYMMYFSAPIFFYYGYLLFNKIKKYSRLDYFLHATVIIFISLFSVYYTVFGILIIIMSGILGSIKNRSYKNIIFALALIIISSVAVGAELLPTKLYTAENGGNSMVANRNLSGTEIYGLKLTQMLIPQPLHFSGRFRIFTGTYSESFPLVNENATSSLGIIGAFGFLSLLIIILLNALNIKLDERLNFLSINNLWLFLFTTIGGFSSMFAMLVSPSLRGWNRISIFIAFASIAAAMILFNKICSTFLSKPTLRWKFIPLLVAICIGIFAYFDQMPYFAMRSAFGNGGNYNNDKVFIEKVESSLPLSAAIYQLPFVFFPESPVTNKLEAYSHLKGFLHSDRLKWSFAAIHGRAGSNFYENLALLPLERQLEIIKKIGFSGIYVDRKGFSDNGASIEKNLNELLGKGPDIINASGEHFFYKIVPSENIITKPEEIVQLTYKKIEANIRYTHDDMQLNFINFSGVEPTLRWTSGKKASITLEFDNLADIRGLLLFDFYTLGVQDIKISLNNNQIWHDKVEYNGVLEIAFDKNLLKNGNNVLTFDLPDARIPSRSDSRELALAFRGFEFR